MVRSKWPCFSQWVLCNTITVTGRCVIICLQICVYGSDPAYVIWWLIECIGKIALLFSSADIKLLKLYPRAYIVCVGVKVLKQSRLKLSWCSFARTEFNRAIRHLSVFTKMFELHALRTCKFCRLLSVIVSIITMQFNKRHPVTRQVSCLGYFPTLFWELQYILTRGVRSRDVLVLRITIQLNNWGGSRSPWPLPVIRPPSAPPPPHTHTHTSAPPSPSPPPRTHCQCHTPIKLFFFFFLFLNSREAVRWDT